MVNWLVWRGPLVVGKLEATRAEIIESRAVYQKFGAVAAVGGARKEKVWVPVCATLCYPVLPGSIVAFVGALPGPSLP